MVFIKRLLSALQAEKAPEGHRMLSAAALTPRYDTDPPELPNRSGLERTRRLHRNT